MKGGKCMKNPFEPIEFPFGKEYIHLEDYIIELAEASKKIGEFNVKMSQTQVGLTYSINHMLNLESLYSTRIEGTQTTIDAVYEASAESDNVAKSTDIQEVLRYCDALDVARKEVIDSPITIKLIKKIHNILLSGNIRKNSNFIAGEFRTQQNRVGEHIPPVAADVERYMGNLERYINEDFNYDDNLPSIVKAALIHAQFETIHPFPDGNGRVGRVLIPIYLYKQNLIDSPYFFLSQELEKNSIKYYSYLQGTREKTAKGFSDWIRFFLQSVVNQISRDILFIDSLDELYQHVVSEMNKNISTCNTETVVKAMFKRPIFTINILYEETGINKNSLRDYVAILRQNNILFKDQKSRNSKYYFMDLIDLIRKN